jgi:opacity protein-like surface antigen
MQARRWPLLTVLPAMTLLTAGNGVEPAEADERAEAEGEAGDDKGWRFELQPYAFIPFGIDGDFTVGDRTVDVDLETSDVFDALTFAAQVRFEAWKHRFGLMVDASYFRTEDELTAPMLPPIDLTAEQYVGDVLAALRLGPSEWAGLELYAGVRGVSLRNEIEIGQEIVIDRDDRYAKFLGGAQISLPLARGVGIELRGFVNAPDVGWSLAGVATFHASWLVLRLGYRWDRINHESIDAAIDADYHGPYVGVGLRW